MFSCAEALIEGSSIHVEAVAIRVKQEMRSCVPAVVVLESIYLLIDNPCVQNIRERMYPSQASFISC